MSHLRFEIVVSTGIANFPGIIVLTFKVGPLGENCSLIAEECEITIRSESMQKETNMGKGRSEEKFLGKNGLKLIIKRLLLAPHLADF
ncbi:unnamed protein product [Dovyalis caffra]|uniref:Uncharacterized protein n=1 Tax=Dovyalis caffra TaxID=77055 RepID=A0AAV1RNK3_9ROSI|nr:unnamed protein product [Dovyalis caffra]